MADKADKNVAYSIAAVQFQGKDRASQVVDLLKKQQKSGDYQVQAWAVIEVNDKGKTDIKQSGHGGWGAAAGAGGGALLGLIGGPAGLIAWALGGALIGGMAGKVGGHEFNSDELKAIGAAMQPNTSGIIVVIEDKMLEKMADDMGGTGGTVLTVTLGDQMSGEVATMTAVDLGDESATADDAAPAADAAAGDSK